jgi:outer membrane protein TolC
VTRCGNRAAELSEERLRAGTIDIVTLLQAEQTWFQQETTLSQVRFAHFQAIVSLYQALGGGWQLDLAEGVPSRGRESISERCVFNEGVE